MSPWCARVKKVWFIDVHIAFYAYWISETDPETLKCKFEIKSRLPLDAEQHFLPHLLENETQVLCRIIVLIAVILIHVKWSECDWVRLLSGGHGCLASVSSTYNTVFLCMLQMVFDPEIFFYVLLPPIIFHAGYSMKRVRWYVQLRQWACVKSQCYLKSVLTTFPVPQCSIAVEFPAVFNLSIMFDRVVLGIPDTLLRRLLSMVK